MKGTTNLTLTYSKDKLTGELQVMYSYKYDASSNKLLDSWLEKRMTGFKMSWRIENIRLPLETTIKDVGRSVQTPGFGGGIIEEAFYLSDQSYTSTLLLPTTEKVSKWALGRQVVDWSLVIMLDVITNEEEGWQEGVQYKAWSKYKLFKVKKNWTDADAHCVNEGGNLASVATEMENNQVKALSGKNSVWLGGSAQEKEGLWKWSHGLSWTYTNWKNGARGDKQNCLKTRSGEWEDYRCTMNYFFVCQFEPKNQALNSNLTLEYTKENLTISMITVEYNHAARSQKLLDSWLGNRRTGFRLTSFVQDSNRSRLTEVMPNLPSDWNPVVTSAMNQDQYLVMMVQLASNARANNMTMEELIDETMKEKTKLINSGFIQYTSMCSGGQVTKGLYPKVFAKILKIKTDYSDKSKFWQLGVIKVKQLSDIEITDEDLTNGFMLFSAIAYCSEPVALSQFLHNLLSNQSPRTIIQATVNTIQSENIKERISRKLLKNFYLSLDKIFHFQLGKIHLATASKSHLESMMAKNWPYFTPFSQEIDQCLNNASCQGVRDIITHLGKP